MQNGANPFGDIRFSHFGHPVHVGSGQPAHDCWLSSVGVTRVGHARFGSGPAAPARVMKRLECIARPVDWLGAALDVFRYVQDDWISDSKVPEDVIKLF